MKEESDHHTRQDLDRLRLSTKASGVPLKVQDKDVLAKLANMVRSAAESELTSDRIKPYGQRTCRYEVYVLELEGGNYYVGMTNRGVQARYEEHLGGKGGAQWTRKYAPLSVVQIVDLGVTTYANAVVMENRVTLDYIDRHGLDRVRGGRVCSVNLKQAKIFFNQLRGVLKRSSERSLASDRIAHGYHP